MKTRNSTKSKLLSSVIALVLCVSMLIGATFAWFTDTASTGVNKIQAGNLDIQLLAENDTSLEGKTLSWQKADGHTGESVLWEPGCTYFTDGFRIKNAGDLNLKFKIAVNGITGGDATLLNAIDFYLTTTKSNDLSSTGAIPLNSFTSGEFKLAPGKFWKGTTDSNDTGSTPTTIYLAGHMKEDAGNEYQGLSIDGIGITVYATQMEAEFDSFNNSYDHDADYIERHATIMNDANGQTITLEAGKTYTVGNATVTVEANGDISYTNNGNAQTVTIETNGGTLTVDAPLDTVNHYGEANFVNVTAVAGNSYHEFGKVAVLSATSGRVVIENGNNVARTQVKSNAAVIAVPQNVVLKTTLAKADGVTKIQLQKGDEAAVVITSEENWTKPVDQIPAELKEVITGTVEAASDNYVARIGNNFYESISDAVAAAKSGETVVMLKDFVNADLAHSVHFSLKNGVTLDGQGHAIRGNADLYMASAVDAVSTVKNVVFQYIHNGSMASQSDCDWYGWENGKQGTMSAIHIDSLQGTANIIDCTFDNADWDAIQITPKDGATINIIGNTFSHSSTTDYSQLRYIHIQNTSLGYSSTTVNVKDNKFYKTRDLDAASICNIGIWSVESSGLNLTGNYFEYNPSEQMIETNSEVPGGTKSLFPARSQANVDTDDLNPVSYIGDVAYLNSDITPAAYEYNGTTFATLQEAIDSNFTSIYLAKDNNESVTVPEGKAMQIYLEDCKLNGTVINNGTLYFFRGTNTEGAAKITNNGTMTLNCNATTGYTVTNNGTLKITSGATYDLSKITNDKNGQVIISGGTFTTKPQADWIAAWYTAVKNEDATCTVRLLNDEEAKAAGAVARYDPATYYKTVQEGFREKNALHLIANASEDVTGAGSIDLYCEEYTFTGSLICPGKYLNIDNGTAILNRIECGTFYGGFRSYDATVTVKDGSATKIIVAKNANVTIEGGTYTGTITVKTGGTGSLTITGGTFTADPTNYVPDTHQTTQNADGTWTVTAK